MRYSYSQKRTIEQYRLDIVRNITDKTLYDIPVLEPTKGDVDCEYFIGINELQHHDIAECGVHFFLDDYQIERVWNDPQKYATKLKNARFVLSPDFSLYTDMPICQQIYNIYRNRLIGAYFQKVGINVVPTIGWSDERSYEFCFCGVPNNNVCAVSNIGCLKDKNARRLWFRGFEEMIKRIKPRQIIIYGTNIDCFDENILYFCNRNIERMRRYGR